MKEKTGEYLVWVDMEFSGLDPKTHVILEIACIITDGELNIIEEGPDLAIFQDSSILDTMDEWNQTHHHESGLLKKVKKSKETHESAENKIIDFIHTYCKEHTGLLCGNSIYQDRCFMREHMPRLDEYLHYRNVDVSTVKELCYRWFPELPHFFKNENHRALDDIRESIKELQYYRNNIFHLKVEREDSV
jgi:oligoribonuclease